MEMVLSLFRVIFTYNYVVTEVDTGYRIILMNVDVIY